MQQFMMNISFLLLSLHYLPIILVSLHLRRLWSTLLLPLLQALFQGTYHPRYPEQDLLHLVGKYHLRSSPNC